MGIGVILLVSIENSHTQLYPLFAILAIGLIAVYLWVLIICTMTYVLIRDKKRLNK